MQMGPASLPTPLSPARGRRLPHAWLTANRRLAHVRRRAWRPMSWPSVAAPGGAAVPEGFLTGARAGIRPGGFSGSSVPNRKGPSPNRPAACRAEAVIPCGRQEAGPGSRPKPPSCCSCRPVSRPSRCPRFAPSSSKATCIRPRPPACRLSDGARTDVSAVRGLKNLWFSELCGSDPP